MASPAPSAQSEIDTRPQEQIAFRFCRECSNMLYPKEDRVTNKLMFACRTCQFSEEAQSSCVFRNNLFNTVGETAGVTQDVGTDPTVGKPVSSSPADEWACCLLCGMPILEMEMEMEKEEEESLEEEGEGKKQLEWLASPAKKEEEEEPQGRTGHAL